MPDRQNPPHIRRKMVVFALSAACATVGVGCGSSEEHFNSGEATRALEALDSIEAAVAEGRCEAAARRSNALAIQSTHVREDRPELGDAYASSVAHLQRLITRDCVEIAADGPTPGVTEPTGPTPDSERPEPTSPTTPDNNDGQDGAQTETPTTPPDNGNGGGGGGGGGGGEGSPPDNSGGAAPGT